MKILIILSLVFGLAAVGVGFYSKVETHPRYKNADSVAEAEAIRKIPADRRSRIDTLMLAVRDDITSALKLQQIAMWILSLLALALAGFALVRKSPGKLRYVGLGLGVWGVLMALLTLP